MGLLVARFWCSVRRGSDENVQDCRKCEEMRLQMSKFTPPRKGRPHPENTCSCCWLLDVWSRVRFEMDLQSALEAMYFYRVCRGRQLYIPGLLRNFFPSPKENPPECWHYKLAFLIPARRG